MTSFYYAEGAREGRYACTREPLLVHLGGLLWFLNHEHYQPGYLSILLLFLVKHVINGVISLPDTTSYDKGKNTLQAYASMCLFPH